MSYFWKRRKADWYEVTDVLKKSFPELKNYYPDDVVSYLRCCSLEFYKKEKIKTNPLIRITLPFAFVFAIILIVISPISYIITGKWGYKMNWVGNWFKHLGF